MDDPMDIFRNFVREQDAISGNKEYQDWQLAGYALNISYDNVVVSTCDQYRMVVGGIGVGDFLLLTQLFQPKNTRTQFILLRVSDTAETPLTQDILRTVFELHRSAMPQADRFTESQLQWSGLQTEVLGVFEAIGEYEDATLSFAGDVGDYAAAHRYCVYKPPADLLDLILNHFVGGQKFQVGTYRPRESRTQGVEHIRIYTSVDDLVDTRTALFGKTRLGKSNIVKLLSEALMARINIEGFPRTGQVIFDVNGEYSNDNPQDGGVSIASRYPDRCIVYALTAKPRTKSKSLRLNFYSYPNDSMAVIRALLEQSQSVKSNYVRSFLSVDIPEPSTLAGLDYGARKRAKRKILIYWAILHRAGFVADTVSLRDVVGDLDPMFGNTLRERIDRHDIDVGDSLDDLCAELEAIAELTHSEKLYSTSRKPLFDSDDLALLHFLKPKSAVATGTTLLRHLRHYHDSNAANFVTEILDEISIGQTVILDLSNAPEAVTKYFSDYLAKAIFAHQTSQFVENRPTKNHVVMIFEEAHNLFPRDSKEITIYHRLAKEGAKYLIGMVYSTQSPTSIDRDLLAQTENWFVLHLASRDDVNALARVNVAFESVRETLLRTKATGYAQMLTRSHRYVVPVQARRFGDPQLEVIDYSLPF